jgi:hypothetical protein
VLPPFCARGGSAADTAARRARAAVGSVFQAAGIALPPNLHEQAARHTRRHTRYSANIENQCRNLLE